MRRRSLALFFVIALIPISYLGLSHYKPDFIVRYTDVDHSKINTKITFLDGFDTSPVGEESFCYVDFGTAEDYRWYRNDSRYESPPEFIEEPRPEWPHEYFVKPWDSQRLEIQYKWVRFAKLRGFYGIILDNVGTIYEYRVKKDDSYGELVISALYNVTEYAHMLGLKVVANVASIELIYKVTFLDGIFREDVYFYEGHRVTDERDVEELLRALYRAKEKGLMVFIVEYVTDFSDFRFVNERLKDFYLFVTDEPYLYDHMPVWYTKSKLVLWVAY